MFQLRESFLFQHSGSLVAGQFGIVAATPQGAVASHRARYEIAKPLP